MIANYNIISLWSISICVLCRCLVCTSVIKNNPLHSRVLVRANWYFSFSQHWYWLRRSFEQFPFDDKQFSIDAFFPISINGGGVSGLINITRFELIWTEQISHCHLDNQCRVTKSFWIISPYVEDGMNTASGEMALPSRIPSWNPWKLELWTISRIQHEFVCVLVVCLE